ncbi:sugar ABC transporter substrate-binding protein [Lichenifustis flavocetrariae]|uniref:Sugar ABC transporter substrate-binding protein n=1 Tax=Lichenifustis flavocetrariae TaxID=2949735 RepID=A0AA41YZN5_9HYPH|nr:sugar ABC transporter substrate-binding protein [Lichenifustis flavocetrariae]MCW6510177.1 sugar ABC transporter substrate-binding protein [Lichenifustis flavocetrariae]
MLRKLMSGQGARTSQLGAASLLVGSIAFAAPAWAAELDLAPFKASLAHFQDKPSFKPAGPAFDARKCMAGKSIVSIPVSSENTFTAAIEKEMKVIADRVGFKLTTWENQGTSQQWAQGINAAIVQKANLIDLLAGSDPRTLVPQIMAAKEAGIPVVASHDSGIEQRAEMMKYVDGDAVVDYRTVGNILADWAIVKRGGKLNALVLIATGPLATGLIQSGVEEELKKCPTCSSKTINVPPVDWATRLTPTVQSALTADPSINYIITIYDGMTQFVVPGVILANAQDRVLIDGFNGTPGALSLIQQGRVDMTIGENLNWIAHAVLDANMRRVCGLTPVNDPFIPFYLFDASNVKETGTPPEVSKGYGDAYVAGYDKLWMMH